MKEQFEQRKLYGDFSVVCQMSDGTKRTWIDKKEQVVGRIVAIVEEYERLGYNLTLRQLHYQLVSRNWIVNATEAYKKLGKILDDCRYSGAIDWNQIEDRGRVPKANYTVTGIPDALQDTIRTYCLDRQAEQEVHVEVWTEKDALSQIFLRSTGAFGLNLCVNKGYTSTSAIYRAYRRFVRRFEANQRVVVLYFGDHDPSGLDMVRDIEDRLRFMFENGNNARCYEHESFDVIPIGLTMQQIKKYKCPPNPTKMGDSRSPAYIKKYGRTCWEVDALPPNVLTQIVEDNIKKHIDMDVYESVMEQENKDRAKLETFIKKHK